MKTSNKLLIAFASALILIPLLGMIYVSQVKYRDGKSGVESRPEITSFDSAAERMTSIAVNAFQTINIADAKGQSGNILISFSLAKSTARCTSCLPTFLPCKDLSTNV